MSDDRLSASEALWERAQRVIPRGVYGHQNGSTHGGHHPKFIARAEGSHFWDVDGNEYVDWMCSYGPMILGYRNPAVDAAVREQMELGDTLSLPGEPMVAYAEQLVARTQGMDWAIFGKNGADATSWAVDTARAHTERSVVVKAKTAYHGARPWTIPQMTGVPAHHRDELIEVVWNDVDGLRAAFAERGEEIACVILSPYDHQPHESHLPGEGWFETVRSLCDEHGAIFIMDDVRAGFRFDLGGSHVRFGAEPDLVCYSKAIANGYALSAGLGRAALREAAEKIFFTGSFFFQSSSFAAASATLAEMERTDALTQIDRIGQLLIDGLEAQAESHGLSFVSTGPTAMPSFHFGDDPEHTMYFEWCDLATEQGAYLHPNHNWFVSAAHSEADIDLTLRATDQAFAAIAAGRQ
jgi:glutamate-1-semialdehyde 2,1-aminomutase